MLTGILPVPIPAWVVAAPAAQATPGGGDSAAIITAFADSCRDFGAHSDIAHLEVRYADGDVVEERRLP